MFGLGTIGTLILFFMVWNMEDSNDAAAQQVAELNYKMDEMMGKHNDEDLIADGEYYSKLSEGIDK